MAASSLSLSTALQQVGNHLWQSTLCLVVVALLTLVLRNNRAHVRHWLWLAASVKFLVPFALLMAIGGQSGWHSLATVQRQTSFLVGTLSEPFSQSAFQFAADAPSGSGIHSLWAAVPAFLVGIWFLGCAAVLLTWGAGWQRVSRAVRQGFPIQGGREVDTLRRLERIGGLNGSIALIGSNMPFEPGVFGIAKPVLLWPQDIGERLDDGQLEAILAHEVCHVRRRDNLAVAIHMLVEAMFWFHPLIWWVERRLVDERERACDEEVIRWGSRPHVYAESILKTCEFYLESPFACLSGVTGSDLKKRIEVIMLNRTTHALSTTKRLLLSSAGVAAVAGPVVVGLLNAPPMQAQGPVTRSRAAVRPEASTIASIRQNTTAAAPPGPPPTVCGMPVSVPPLPNLFLLPPAGSGPVLWMIAPCFAAQGNVSRVNIQTYLGELTEPQGRISDRAWGS